MMRDLYSDVKKGQRGKPVYHPEDHITNPGTSNDYWSAGTTFEERVVNHHRICPGMAYATKILPYFFTEEVLAIHQDSGKV